MYQEKLKTWVVDWGGKFMNFKFCLILDIVDGAQFEENVSRELDYIQDHVIETQ